MPNTIYRYKDGKYIDPRYTEFVIANESAVSDLPTDVAPGSKAFCPSTGGTFILDPEGEWALFDGIGEMVTFLANNVTKGHVVRISAARTVSECTANGTFDGVCIFTGDGTAAVQLDGIVTVRYSGSAPGYGRAVLVANGIGGVKQAESGETYVVIDKNTTAHTITIIL